MKKLLLCTFEDADISEEGPSMRFELEEDSPAELLKNLTGRKLSSSESESRLVHDCTWSFSTSSPNSFSHLKRFSWGPCSDNS